MASRRGMELAVNTLVVLILGIILMGGGIALIYNIYNRGVVIPDRVNAQTQQELFKLILSSKERIKVLNNVQTVEIGKTSTYPVAFQNQINTSSATFRVIPNPLCVVATSNTACVDPSSATNCPTAFALEGPYTLPRFESKAFNVVVNVPKNAYGGEYVFQVVVKNVTGSIESDYAKVKIVVNVP